jgi:hypothetical protein
MLDALTPDHLSSTDWETMPTETNAVSNFWSWTGAELTSDFDWSFLGESFA